MNDLQKREIFLKKLRIQKIKKKLAYLTLLHEETRICRGCGREFTCEHESRQKYCNPLCRQNSKYERKLGL